MEHAANVVEVDEELNLTTIARWEQRVESAGRTSRTVVLDLTSVPFIDSAGVRTLFRWVLAAERVGIHLIVVAPPKSPVRRLLEILELEMIAPVVDSRQAVGVVGSPAASTPEGPGRPDPRDTEPSGGSGMLRW